MTEAEWLACTDPVKLLNHLGLPQGDRKLCLLALACCRAIWPLLPDPVMREGLELAEQFMEGAVTQEQLSANSWRVEGALYGGVGYYAYRPNTPLSEAMARWVANVETISSRDLRAMACCGGEELPNNLLILLNDAGYFADHVVCANTYPEILTCSSYRRFVNVALIREVFGNPFRPFTINPAWLHWNDRTVSRLAQTIYDERRFDDLPVLADALEDAGCDNAEILAHCRGAGPHVRGCWVVDALLNKA